MTNQQYKEEVKDTFNRCVQFQRGQAHRKLGYACLSTNGAYLDGWYSPDKRIPPYVTEQEMEDMGL